MKIRIPSAPRQTTRHILTGRIAAACVVAIAAAGQSFAATGNWVPTAGGTYSWNSSPNWTAAFPNGAGETAGINLNILGDQIINLNAATTVGILNLGDTVGTSIITIASGAGTNSLIFDNSGAGAQLTKNGINVADTISAGVTLFDDLTITNNGSFGRNNALALTGKITGAKKITISGGGSTYLKATTNDYSGGLTLNSGAIVTGSNSAVFGTGTVTLNGGAVDTSFSGAGGQVLITSNATVWNGNFQVGTSGTGTGTWNNNGTVLLGASVAFSQLTSGVLNLSNVVSDGGSTRSLTVTNGTMSLSGANTYGGGTILTAGLLNINNSGSGGTSSAVGIGTLSLNGGTIDNTSAGLVTLSTNNLINTGGNVTFTGTQSLNLGTGAITLNSTRTFTINGGTLTLGGAIGVGAQGVVKGGVGTLALTSASSANTGANTINAGVLEVTKMSNGSAVSSLGNQTNAAANLIFGAQTAVLRYVGSGDTTDRSFTYSNVVGGGATIESSGSGALVFNGAIAIGLGATTNQTRLLTLGGTNTNTNTFGKVITDNGATGATSLTKSGASVWSLTSNNTYTGGTAIGGGTLNLGVGQSGTGGPLGGSGAVSTVGTITFSGGTLQYSASNTVDYSSRFGSGVNQFSIDTNAQTVVYATQIIAAANASTFTKLGTGTLTLSSAVSRYTGATTITGGTLSVASMANGGADSAIGKSSSAATSLVFDGGALQYTGATQVTDRAFTINAAKTATIDVTNSLSLVGATGAATTGALTKTGVGTLILTGANTYTGATNVNGGTLAITGTLSGTTAVNINSGTLLISANANNVVNTAANVTLNGGKLGLDSTVSGKSQGYGSLTLSANSVLDFGSGPGNTFSFASVGTHTGGTTLALVNWSSTLSGSDPGTGLAGTDDRLIFAGSSTDFTNVFATNEVSFNGVGGYAAINITGGYEIVPVPEPTTTALIGSMALCALIGYRERRRFLPRGHRSAKAWTNFQRFSGNSSWGSPE